jgi:hypothetical protein
MSVAQKTATVTGTTVIKKTAIPNNHHVTFAGFLYMKLANEAVNKKNPIKTLMIVNVT